MVSLKVDYTDNQMIIDFAKTKQNALDNVQTYFKDMICDFSVSLSKEVSGNDFDMEVVDDVVFNLKSASDKIRELLENINECTSVSGLIEILNNEFDDDALVFYLLFDTPISIQ